MMYMKVNNVSNPVMAQTIKPMGCTCRELSHGAHLNHPMVHGGMHGHLVKTVSLWVPLGLTA